MSGGSDAQYQREYRAARPDVRADKARREREWRAAVKQLIARHAAEFDEILAEVRKDHPRSPHGRPWRTYSKEGT